MAGPVVLDLTESTTRSTVSAALVGQSPPWLVAALICDQRRRAPPSALARRVEPRTPRPEPRSLTMSTPTLSRDVSAPLSTNPHLLRWVSEMARGRNAVRNYPRGLIEAGGVPSMLSWADL